MADIIKLSFPAIRGYWEVPIVFEDEHLLALNKPPGLLTSPDRNDPTRPSLMQLLHGGIENRKPWAAARNLTYLMNAHRLDFETSGVILMAKAKPVLIELANLFGSEKPAIKYICLVQGVPPEDEFEIEVKISAHPLRLGEMCIDARQGKRALTRFKVLERFTRWSLVEARPATNRMHQVRIHLRHARFPIVGDKLYRGRQLMLSSFKKDYRLKPGQEQRPLISMTALHLDELSLVHPVTQQPIAMQAEWGKDLKVAVKFLRRHAIGGGPGAAVMESEAEDDSFEDENP